jgi:hypothetical protein
MIAENIEIMDNSTRRKKITNYISDNPGCSIQDIVKDGEKKGYGAKKTIENILDELEKENILRKGKEKPNSKQYQLFIDEENLFLIIPSQLNELFSRLKIFMEQLKSMYFKPFADWPNFDHAFATMRFSSETEKTYYLLGRILKLPIVIVDVINDAFMFHYYCIWPTKITNQHILTKLISLYFTKISEMNIYLSKEIDNLKNYFKEFDKIFPKNMHIYQSYADSKSYSPLKKIIALEHSCQIPYLGDELDFVLDYLWEINRDYLQYIYPELNTYGLVDSIDITNREIIHGEFCTLLNNIGKHHPLIM